MSYPTKITFVLKSPLLQHYVDDFNQDFDESIKVDAVVDLKFGADTINQAAPLIIWIATTYSEGIIEALGEKTFDLVLSKLNVFITKYCKTSKGQATDIKIKITTGETKYEFEATNVTEQNVDNALLNFHSTVLKQTK